MDRKPINKAVLLAGMLLILAGCTGKMGGSGDADGLTTVRIELQPDGYAATKSSFTWGDAQINDIQIVVTEDNGEVYEVLYSQSVTGLSFTGLVGHHYNATAVANIGKQVSVSEMSGYTDLSEVQSAAEIARHGIPMCSADNDGITLSQTDNKLTLTMIRLLARVDFSIDRSMLGSPDGYIVRSVGIYDSPGGTFDMSSSEDVAVLNSGGSLSLYAYENMQGTLLPGNTDPWAKVPDSIGSASGKCSFLEVKCSYANQGLSCDDITYRMYLGQDATTNFDVRRNTVYRLTLIPTEEEIYGERGSWKIESEWWVDKRPVSLAFAETSKSIYVDGPNAGDNGRWMTDLIVTYADGTTAHVSGDLTSVSPEVASVSGMVVTGKSVGSATINGSYTEYGVTVTTTVPAVVTVTDPLLALRLEPEKLEMSQGSSFSDWLVTAVYPSGDRELDNNASGLVWGFESTTHEAGKEEQHASGSGRTVSDFTKTTSQGGSIVTVTCNDYAPLTGMATLTATFTDGGVTKSDSSEITSTEKTVDHYEFVVSPASLILEVRAQASVKSEFRAVYTDGSKGLSTSVKAAWTTASGSKRTVSASALNNSGVTQSSFFVQGVSEGTDVIIATYVKDGITYTGSCDVTVTASSEPDQPDDPDEPDEPDDPQGPVVTYGYRLEIVNGGQLGVGDSATFIVKLYTDVYHDGVLYLTDTVGAVIENDRVNWGFGTEPDNMTGTDTHATLTQSGVITGTSVGDCTVIVTLKTDPEVYATKDIEVIESSAGIDLSIQWDGTWARIEIGF